jgi:hypothetical protein
MLELRFDEWWMREELDKDRLAAYATQSGNKALQERIQLLMKTYSDD